MPTRGWQFWYKSIRWPCWALDWRSFWRAVTSLVFSSMSRRIEVSCVWLFLIFECTTECTRGLGLPIEAAESSARASASDCLRFNVASISPTVFSRVVYLLLAFLDATSFSASMASRSLFLCAASFAASSSSALALSRT